MRASLIAVALLLGSLPASARDLTLPDRKLTPGVVALHDVAEICNKKWGRDHRFVTSAMKKEVFASYGLTGNTDPSCKKDAHGRRCEVDHLISRELGGADDVKNLWPQPYGSKPWNAVLKDKLENRLHKEVCSGNLPLEDAQTEIAKDWTAAYIVYFGEP